MLNAHAVVFYDDVANNCNDADFGSDTGALNLIHVVYAYGTSGDHGNYLVLAGDAGSIGTAIVYILLMSVSNDTNDDDVANTL